MIIDKKMNLFEKKIQKYFYLSSTGFLLLILSDLFIVHQISPLWPVPPIGDYGEGICKMKFIEISGIEAVGG